MRHVIALAGLAFGLASCCCPPSGGDGCVRVATKEARPAIAASLVTDHHFIGDLVLMRLKARTQEDMDAARDSVVTDVRKTVGSGRDLRAEWSVLIVSAPSLEQDRVATTLMSLRSRGSLASRTPGGEADVFTSRAHDVSFMLPRLPRIQVVGPGTQSDIPKEAALLEAIWEQIGITPDESGPSMRLREGSLIAEAAAPMQDKIASALSDARQQIKSLRGD